MKNPEIAILAVLAAVLLVGWAVIQLDIYGDTSVEVENNGDSIDVRVDGFLPADYSYSILSGADVSANLYYWYDTSLQTSMSHDQQAQFFDSLDSLLKVRNHAAGERIATERLVEVLSDLSSASETAVYFCAGVLPKAVVDNDLLKNWVSAGGTIHWTGEAMGKYVTSENGVEEFDARYFFPEGSVSEKSQSEAHIHTYWSQRLVPTLTNCSYGVNVQMLTDEGYNTVSLGLLNDAGYSSFAVTDYDAGRIYTMGLYTEGTVPAYYMMISADIISYGIDTDTTEVTSVSGDKGYGAKQFTIDHTATAGETLIVKTGAPFTNWAKVFTL